MSDPLQIPFSVWKYQGHEGYVFLGEKTKSGKWGDTSFSWPGQKGKIKEWVEEHQSKESNLYWCPLIFNKARRIKENVVPGKVLYSDLDPVNPDTVTIRPTIAWESSPKRYQALWLLKEEVNPGDLEIINKALTYSMGADRGGWDLTQVLRIPGTFNYKYKPPKPGKLLWEDGKKYGKVDIESKVKPLPESNIKGPDTTGVKLVELLSKYRKKIPSKVSRMLQYPESRIEKGHRSEILWYLEKELIKALIPVEDAALIIKLSPWNKYQGRRDEWTRIMTEVGKVYEEYRNGEVEGEEETEGGQEEEDEEVNKLPVQSYEEIMSGGGSHPGWLVNGIWLKRSHGIIAGEPKTYKSTIALDLAVSVASGRPLWGKYQVEETGPVIVVQNENAEWIIKDRLEKIITHKGIVGKVTKGKDRIYYVKFPEILPITFLNNFGYTFSDPLHREMLEELIEEVKPVLVIFDPLYLMFEGEINSAKDLQPILAWLLELRQNYNTAVQIIHHWNKGGTSSRGGQRMLGSTTLHGWTESGLFIQSHENEDDNTSAKVEIEREFRAAGLMPKLSLTIKMGPTGVPVYKPELTDVEDNDNKGTGAELLDLLSMYTGGLSSSQVAKEMGVSRRKVMSLLEKVKDSVIVSRGERGSVHIKLKGGN